MSKLVNKCSVCSYLYCLNCSKAVDYKNFCSPECEEVGEKNEFSK